MDNELLQALLYDIRKEKDLEKIHRLVMVYQDDNCDDEDLDFYLEDDDEDEL